MNTSKHSNTTVVFLSLLLLCVTSFKQASMADTPIYIHLTASDTLQYSDSDASAKFTYKNADTHFDVLWTGVLNDLAPDIYIPNPPTVSGGGNISIGSTTSSCSGSFSVDLAFPPTLGIVGYQDLISPFQQQFDYVTFKLANSSLSRNGGGTQATLDDQTAVYPCNVPQGLNQLSGNGVSPQSHTLDYTPKDQILMNDSNPEYAALQRSGYAIARINVRQLPQIVPVTFKSTYVLGTTTSVYNWSGQIEVTAGQPIPAPTNPTILFTPEPDPTVAATPTPVTIIDFDNYLGELVQHIVEIIKSHAKKPSKSAAAVSDNGDKASYNHVNNTVTIDLAAGTPGAGTVTPTYSVKAKGESRATISVGSIFAFKAGSHPAFKFKLPNSMVAAALSRSASKVTVTLAIVPKKGKKISKHVSFSLKKG